MSCNGFHAEPLFLVAGFDVFRLTLLLVSVAGFVALRHSEFFLRSVLLLIHSTRVLAPRPGSLFEVCNIRAAVGFVNRLSRAAGVSLPAEFALGRERPRSLFIRSCFGPREFLPFAREARMGHAGASAAGPFRTALTAICFSFVCISFAGPLILNHCTTGARR